MNAAHILTLDQLPGLTTFPSFHTAMGIICTWCSRGSIGLFPLMLIINGLMIASTPILGSHYLADVIGGALLAIAAIYLLRSIETTCDPLASTSSEGAR
jgi:membrane-associated phospholipid phosphatase